jgi:site-specific recombinase XerD
LFNLSFSHAITMTRSVHILQHTFCSHLAMRGAPARAIQELAGHQDLATTQRYMHLSPAALDAAIRLLETGSEFRGEIMEAAGKSATEGRA